MDSATIDVMDKKTKELNPKKHSKEWTNIVKLIDMAFKGEDILNCFLNGVLLLIPKDIPGEFRGIALLDIL